MLSYTVSCGSCDCAVAWGVAVGGSWVGTLVRVALGGKDVGVFVVGGNQAFMFGRMKPREERTHSVDQIIEQLRPGMAAIPGLFVFMQNPPPITVSGQNSPSAYQLTLQSVNGPQFTIIEGFPVQFIPAYNDLVREAVEKAATLTYRGVEAKVVKAEYRY